MSVRIRPAVSEPDIKMIPLSLIRRDGHTQHRTTVDSSTLEEYVQLTRSGIKFPPIRLWWDGSDFWLSDGFQRVAAAERTGCVEILAEVRCGTLSDAKWDSYSANSTHGMRRTPEETLRVIQLALVYPRAAQISNIELAKHLNIPETTLRRWREKLSPPSGEDTVRLVQRKGIQYQQRVSKIGKARRAVKRKRNNELRADLKQMKEVGSPATRRLLNIIGNWLFAGGQPADCLHALEYFVTTVYQDGNGTRREANHTDRKT